MSGRTTRIVSTEIFWFSLIALFTILSAIPLFGVIKDELLQTNVILAALFAFYFRVVLFFRQIPYLQPLGVQLLLFLGNIPLFVTVLGVIQERIYAFDTADLRQFFHADAILTPETLIDKFQLFRTEFLLFSVGLLILVVLTEFRIILAFVERIKKIE